MSKKMRLECEHCGEPLTPRDGWFAWFTEDGVRRVVDCALTCNGVRGCNDKVAKRFTDRGCSEWDHHLHTFTGRSNLPRTLVLIIDYDWEPKALAKLLNYIPRFVDEKGTK